MRHEEISGLAEKRLSIGYKRKDLGQFEGSPSKKARNSPKDITVYRECTCEEEKSFTTASPHDMII